MNGPWAPGEPELLVKLKERLDEQKIDYSKLMDYDLIRFLRARKHDIKKAADMLTASLKWRNEVGADTILADSSGIKDFELLHSYWPGNFHGVDKTGTPVYYERISTIDVKPILKAFKADDILRYHIYCQEDVCQRVKQSMMKQNTPLWGKIVVEDLAGLSWKHSYRTAFSLMKRKVEIDEANYPETLKCLYVINAPKIFSVLWKVVKPLFDPQTLSKIKIFSADYKDALLSDIDVDNLPAQYGGNCPKCSTGKCLTGGGSWKQHLVNQGQATSLPPTEEEDDDDDFVDAEDDELPKVIFSELKIEEE